MTKRTSLEQLEGPPALHGLYEDVGKLEHGGTRLALKGFRFDPVGKLPLYVFNLTNEQGAIVGEYQFAPGAPEAVGEIGNVGGFVAPEFRNRHHSQEAIKALSVLAARHGMDSFIITCPKDDAPARTGLGKVGVERTPCNGDLCYYDIPAARN